MFQKGCCPYAFKVNNIYLFWDKIIDNFFNLFEECINKKYINQINSNELENNLSIFDKSNNDSLQEGKTKNNSNIFIATHRLGLVKYRVGQDMFRRKLLIKFNKKYAFTGIEEEEMLLLIYNFALGGIEWWIRKRCQ